MWQFAKNWVVGAIACLYVALAGAANGDILERAMIDGDNDASFIAERVVYESDGLRIVGYLAYPRAAPAGAVRLPCVLWNRGGNHEYGANTPANFRAHDKRVTD